MGAEFIVMPLLIAAFFGIFYLHYSTRNRERMALIEKGADASIFVKGKSNRTNLENTYSEPGSFVNGNWVGIFIASCFTTIWE